MARIPTLMDGTEVVLGSTVAADGFLTMDRRGRDAKAAPFG